jgi:hypothetical protein
LVIFVVVLRVPSLIGNLVNRPNHFKANVEYFQRGGVGQGMANPTFLKVSGLWQFDWTSFGVLTPCFCCGSGLIGTCFGVLG